MVDFASDTASVADSTMSTPQSGQITKIVNLIFASNGRPLVKKLSAEFADGSKSFKLGLIQLICVSSFVF